MDGKKYDGKEEEKEDDEDEEPACDNRPLRRKSVSCYRQREAEEGCGELGERVQRVRARVRCNAMQRLKCVNLRARAQ